MGGFIFCGGIGSGKSYIGTTMARWVIENGRKVAHNWDIHWNTEDRKLATRFNDISEVATLEDTDIFIDEAQATAGARDWEKLSPKIRNWLSQHRHYGCNLIFLSQHYKFVDVYVRRLCPEGTWSVFRLLNMTFAVERPESDPELGTLGGVDIWSLRAFQRPWRDLDHPWPIGSFSDLLRLSKTTAGMYGTREKTTGAAAAASLAAAKPPPKNNFGQTSIHDYVPKDPGPIM